MSSPVVSYFFTYLCCVLLYCINGCALGKKCCASATDLASVKGSLILYDLVGDDERITHAQTMANFFALPLPIKRS